MAAVPSGAPSTRKVTLPVGAPTLALSLAVSATGAPNVEGLGDDESDRPAAPALTI